LAQVSESIKWAHVQSCQSCLVQAVIEYLVLLCCARVTMVFPFSLENYATMLGVIFGSEYKRAKLVLQKSVRLRRNNQQQRSSDPLPTRSL
jgi:hypothetical protein